MKLNSIFLGKVGICCGRKLRNFNGNFVNFSGVFNRNYSEIPIKNKELEGSIGELKDNKEIKFKKGKKKISTRHRLTKTMREIKRKEHILFKENKRKAEILNIDPILGTKTPFIESILSLDSLSNKLLYSVDNAEFEKVSYAAQSATLNIISGDKSLNDKGIEGKYIESEEKKRLALRRILSIQNGCSKDIKSALIKETIEKFNFNNEGESKNYNSGSSDVQAAILTVKIYMNYHHYISNLKDFKARNKLRMLVQARQGVLKYLKRKDPILYEKTLVKIGLNDAAVFTPFDMSYKSRFLVNPVEVGNKRIKFTKKERKEFGDRILLLKKRQLAN